MKKDVNIVGTTPMIVKKISKVQLSKQSVENQSVDLLDYTHPAIYALIPVLEKDGKYSSMETGEVVPVLEMDQVVPINIGTALFFKDGTKLVYTRGWLKGLYGKFFVKNEVTSTAPNIHVFGEGDPEPIK